MRSLEMGEAGTELLGAQGRGGRRSEPRVSAVAQGRTRRWVRRTGTVGAVGAANRGCGRRGAVMSGEVVASSMNSRPRTSVTSDFCRQAEITE